jgi:serine/threonine protein kinase
MQPGTRLGHYEILSAIGKGGMGEVWRARDANLDREVAIKTLPEAFSTDADRLARFEREAKLLASLNHPNIAAIYGLEESDGQHFSSWNSSKGTPWPIGRRAARSLSTNRSRSPDRSPKPLKPRMKRV